MDREQILEKAQELGACIAESRIKARAEAANQALEGDETAVNLIKGYNNKRQEKLASFGDRQPTAEEAQAVNAYLQEAFNKIAANDTIREYIEANREMEQVLEQVDRIIKEAITGGHGCGGSCAECGGCGHSHEA